MGIKTNKFARIFELKGFQVLYHINPRTKTIDVHTLIGHQYYNGSLGFADGNAPKGMTLPQVLESLTEKDAEMFLENAFNAAIVDATRKESKIIKPDRRLV